MRANYARPLEPPTLLALIPLPPGAVQPAGVPIDWNPDPQASRLPAQPMKVSAGPEPITLVPYGCTRFRISMFPVTERLAQRLPPDKSRGR